MKPIKRVTGLKDYLYGYQCPNCRQYILNYKENPKKCECGCELNWETEVSNKS